MSADMTTDYTDELRLRARALRGDAEELRRRACELEVEIITWQQAPLPEKLPAAKRRRGRKSV